MCGDGRDAPRHAFLKPRAEKINTGYTAKRLLLLDAVIVLIVIKTERI
jgi:hypothetical protein